MPVVLIEVRKRYEFNEEKALMLAVNDAVQEVFQIFNKGSMEVRLLAHEPHRVLVPVDAANPNLCQYPELFTLISIDCYPGRSLDTKRALYTRIVDNLEPLGIPKDHVKILIRESAKENWGIRGGQAGCDVDVGYVVQV